MNANGPCPHCKGTGNIIEKAKPPFVLRYNYQGDSEIGREEYKTYALARKAADKIMERDRSVNVDVIASNGFTTIQSST